MFKIKKYILIVIFFLNFFIIFDYAFATPDTGKIAEYFSRTGNGFPSIHTMGSTLLTILTYVGYAAAICMILITAIQYLTANAQKRAVLKEKLWLIAIGIFLLAGGIPLLEIIGTIMENFNNSF